jgi:hypothetical protein
MRGLWGWGIAATAAMVGLMPIQGRAVDNKEVSCDNFVLGYNGAGMKKHCRQGDISSGTASADVSQLEVDGDKFVMVVSYYQSGFRTYYPITPLEKLAERNGSFNRLGDWQGSRRVAGFDLEAFSATLQQAQSSIYCAVFSRYGGEVGRSGEVAGRLELEGGPGYKNFVVGFYCSGFKAVGTEPPPSDFYLDAEAALVAIRDPL